jgi:S-formylglutathione hydrolase FrmB
MARVKRSTVRGLGALACAAVVTGVGMPPVAPAAAASNAFFQGCRPQSQPITVVVGRVICQLMDSPMLGAPTAFSYYVPPGCAPWLKRRCPVLYLLHGFGGDYTSMLGTQSQPSAWVAALSSGPAVDPSSVPDSWNYSDPAAWTSKPALDLILVAPDGRTAPNGYGPGPGLDGFWVDWNSRYGMGGDHQAYATPPPRFESSLIGELMPLVERDFPTGHGRPWRAIAGTSLGGYGAYLQGLRHPDLWSSMGSVSGAFNFLFAPGVDPLSVPVAVSLQPPASLPYAAMSGPVSVLPFGAIPGAAQDVAVAVLALGDPGADQAHYRGNMPRDLALNARASSGGMQSLYIRGFSNDTVPRRTADFASPQSYLIAQGFEDIVLPMNVEMNAAFSDEGVSNDYALHPGLHDDVYRNAWLRGQVEAQYARLRHADGGGQPTPQPSIFDYRTVDTDVSIWGWHLSVQRTPVEFLTLRNVSCRSITLQGSGIVTVSVPDVCADQHDTVRAFTVDLGPSMPADEPAGVSGTGAYERTVTVSLQPSVS